MTMEERKGVQVWFIFLNEMDPQKAYDIGARVSQSLRGIYIATSFYSTGNPAQYKQALNVFVPQDKVGAVVNTLAKEFGLELNKGFLYTANPGLQYVPRTNVSQTTA